MIIDDSWIMSVEEPPLPEISARELKDMLSQKGPEEGSIQKCSSKKRE